MAKGVPPAFKNITFHPQGTTVIGFYDEPFDDAGKFVSYLYSVLSLEDISYSITPKFIYSQLPDAFICVESYYRWLGFDINRGYNSLFKWVRDNLNYIMNSEYYSFEITIKGDSISLRLILVFLYFIFL